MNRPQVSWIARQYELQIRGKKCVHALASLYGKDFKRTSDFHLNLLEIDLVEVGSMKPFNPAEQYMNTASVNTDVVKHYLLEVEVPDNFDEIEAGPRRTIELHVKKECQLVELACRDRHPIEHLQLALEIASEFLSNEWKEVKEKVEAVEPPQSNKYIVL